MTSLPENSPPLIGDGARDTAVRRLQEAYAEGLISHEELDVRLDRVLTATARDQLDSALVSLPAERPDTTATIGAAGGLIRRRGAWRVPRFLKVESATGRVRLDLSRAIIKHPVIDIDLQLGTGGARITVPRDAEVEIADLHTGWKDLRYKPRQGSGRAGPKIRISGTIVFGRLRIRHARR